MQSNGVISLGYDKTIFARNLNYYLAKNGENQIDIVRFLGVSKSTVSAYCSGSQVPRIDKIELLAQHFGIEKSDLIEQKQPSVSEGLSKEEQALLTAFRALTPDQQAFVLRQLSAAQPAPEGQDSAESSQ